MGIWDEALKVLAPAGNSTASAIAVDGHERSDLHSGLPYWLVKNGLGPDHPRLVSDIRTDVVIVGGGITGALCAYVLSKAGVPCVVVDARAIATGSTCASTALLQYEIDIPLYRLVGMVGEKDAVRSYQLCARSIESLKSIAAEVGLEAFAMRPSVQYASKQAHVKGLVKEQAIRAANGLPADLFQGADAVGEVLPFEAPAVLRSTLAAEVDAYRFTHLLLRKGIEAGVRVFQRTPVVDFRDNGTGVELRTAHGPVVRAKHVVHATGYETRDELPKDVIQLHSTYAMISEPLDHAPWADRALIWETATPYLYMRTTDDDRIILGGRDEPFRSPPMRDALMGRKIQLLHDDFTALLPEVPFRREFAWCGTFGSTKDGLPYIDRGPRHRNSFYALGMGGNGITFSMIAAESIRDRILGRPDPDSNIFRFDR